MDESRFDQLTKGLWSNRFSRRMALAVGGAGLGTAALSKVQHGSAQDATPPAAEPQATPAAAGENPSFLFVQLFDHGTWTRDSGDDSVFLLNLTGAAAQTLFFSDRPERIVGTVDTAQFLDTLGFTPINPPNAALVVRTPEGARDVLVIELFDPAYSEDINDPGNVTVAYRARVLESYHGDGLTAWVAEQDDEELPAQFEDISLFIDDCPDMFDCQGWVTVNEDGHWVTLGPVPGGPYGRCWSWAGLYCRPCFNSADYYDGLCNNAYAGCNGQCNTSCGIGSCP